MTKTELIESIAEGAGISKAAAGRAVSTGISEITKALVNGDKVAIIGFGTFSVSKRAAHSGRNPQTGEAITIPESLVPKFSAGKGLKDAVNK